MSFSFEVKQEILDIKNRNKHCIIAEIAGLLQNNFKVSNNLSPALYFFSENKFFSQRICGLIKENFNTIINVKVSKSFNAKKHYNYFCVFENARDFLLALGILSNDNVFHSKRNYATKSMLKNFCCKGSYLRGEFLISGSISNPNKNYHLEFFKSSEEDAKNLAKILNNFEFNSKIIHRKGYFVVYVKEGDKISDFLKLIGAHTSALTLESLMVEKDIRNSINRKQNCEMANMNKTIEAAVKQINDIEFIINNKGISFLPNNLKEVALIRLQNTDLSLVEIGKMTTKPMSKSSVNYKLNKLCTIAENLRRD